MFGISFFVSIATFKNVAGFKYAKPLGLWIVSLLWPLICTVVYVVSQLVLVFRTLDDRWPIGDIVFGAAFFTIAQVILFAFSATICNAIKHYIDGLFFFALCMLLSVMMVYKYWDSITVRPSSFAFLKTMLIYVSFVYRFVERGPGVLCGLESDSMGGEGPTTRRRGPPRVLRRSERIQRPREPRRRRQRRPTIRRRWARIPTTRRAVLSLTRRTDGMAALLHIDDISLVSS